MKNDESCREEFRKAPGKIALLPYCLQDFSVNCKSEKAGFDYQCRHCSAKCFQNHASMILKANNIEPFIWSGSNMKKLAGHTPEEKNPKWILLLISGSILTGIMAGIYPAIYLSSFRWIFALAGIITLGIALLTVSWQSWRAATRNPVEALRYE